MRSFSMGFGAVLLGLALAACNQTGAGSVAGGVAAALDPTGISGAAMDVADAAETASGASRVDFSAIAVRLKDVAAGKTSGPDYMAPLDRQIAATMAKQSAKMARSAAQAGIDAALTGGMSLSGSAFHLATQGAGNAMLAGQLAGARAQASADVAKAEAQRKAEQLMPDADRPLEAQAVLSILEGGGGNSVAWQNPATGASGKVTLKPMDKRMFGGLDCRMFLREWRSGGTVRRGDMLACRDKGEWYDFS
ncbi:RT0821/Lpp0805 family surface protein [Microvirga arsenatis]|uniref:Surface antigen domain-containing protein n=1 Tax=Microvirga arsenatis TaxID=2692265 RepID=A0ABW9YU14_9HYPH|nr:RT0821/Lpp0805 family surface protein [Microvirga arsenatis]NBJ09623.1 hypothetical protein [Microvirga arsenatis]NBJ23518.1 hypothetical protein [Microvirga arsenatis]